MDLEERCSSDLAGGLFEPGYLIGLGAFGALYDVELYLITLFEALVPLALDGAVMDEDIGTLVAAEEAVPLCIVKPLYRSPVLCQDQLPFRYIRSLECIGCGTSVPMAMLLSCLTDSDAKVMARGFLC